MPISIVIIPWTFISRPSQQMSRGTAVFDKSSNHISSPDGVTSPIRAIGCRPSAPSFRRFFPSVVQSARVPTEKEKEKSGARKIAILSLNEEIERALRAERRYGDHKPRGPQNTLHGKVIQLVREAKREMSCNEVQYFLHVRHVV